MYVQPQNRPRVASTGEDASDVSDGEDTDHSQDWKTDDGEDSDEVASSKSWRSKLAVKPFFSAVELVTPVYVWVMCLLSPQEKEEGNILTCVHPTPYTLHPAPYTLHLTPCTLHPTPYTP